MIQIFKEGIKSNGAMLLNLLKNKELLSLLKNIDDDFRMQFNLALIDSKVEEQAENAIKKVAQFAEKTPLINESVKGSNFPCTLFYCNLSGDSKDKLNVSVSDPLAPSTSTVH